MVMLTGMSSVPIELVLIIMENATLKDLYNLTQTCHKFYELGKTSRRYWQDGSDCQERLILPTGHTLETVPIEQLISLAARSLSIAEALEHEIITPKSFVVSPSRSWTTHNEIGHLALPGNAWFVDWGNESVSIRRNEAGWEHISCRLGSDEDLSKPFQYKVLGDGAIMLAFVASNARGHSAQPEGQDHGIIRTIHVRFPDERGDPAAPVISHKQDFIFPHRVHNLYMSGDIFIAEASSSVQLLNYATRAGVLLLFADDYELDSDAGLIFQISIHEQANKLRINGGWLRGQDEPESQRRFVRRVIALANYPHDILDPRDSSLDEASDISWTSIPFQLTHLFNEPRWPAATIQPLPAGLLASAICIRDFEIVEPSVEEGEPEAQHYVSLLLHDDRLVAYETDTVVRPDPRGQPAVPDAGLASFEGPWEAPKDVIDVPILDSKTKQVKTMHLALPTHCARMLAYRVAGWDSLRGRLLLNAAFEFKENGSASRLLYAIQY